MAELSVDFTNDQSRFEAVLIQRGRDVLDGELNDMQRIGRIRCYRSAMVQDNDDGRRAGRWARCRCSGIEIVPGGNPDEIDIQPVALGGASYGVIEFRGYTFELTSAITLTGVAAAGAVAEWQQIYFTIEETEVSGADDGSIVVDKLGETARRIRLDVTFALGAVNTDTASALATLEEPWEGGTKVCLLGLLNRAALAALPVTAAQLQPHWRVPSTVARFQDRNMLMCPVSPAVESYVSWDSATGDLEFVNVGLCVFGQPNTEGTPRALMRSFASTPINIADGEALWYIAERGQLGIAAATAQIVYGEGAHPPVTARGRFEVLALSELNHGILTSPTDENLDERFFVCMRDGDNVIFRDGDVLLDTTSDAVTRAAVKYFGGGGTFDIAKYPEAPGPDGDVIPSLLERYVPDAGSMKLIYAAAAGPTGQFSRVYSAHDVGNGNFVGLIFTTNAAWDPGSSNWTADDAAAASSAFRSGVDISSGLARSTWSSRSAGGTDPWDDDNWPLGSDNLEQVIRIASGGFLIGADVASSRIQGFRRLTLTGTGDPAPNANIESNALYAASIPKAWATISVTAGVVTLLDSFGLNADPTVSGTAVRFVLDRTMVNDYYPVVVTSLAAANSYRVSKIAGGTTFDVIGATPAGVGLNYGADVDTFSVVVHGRHA